MIVMLKCEKCGNVLKVAVDPETEHVPCCFRCVGDLNRALGPGCTISAGIHWDTLVATRWTILSVEAEELPEPSPEMVEMVRNSLAD